MVEKLFLVEVGAALLLLLPTTVDERVNKNSGIVETASAPLIDRKKDSESSPVPETSLV